MFYINYLHNQFLYFVYFFFFDFVKKNLLPHSIWFERKEMKLFATNKIYYSKMWRSQYQIESILIDLNAWERKIEKKKHISVIFICHSVLLTVAVCQAIESLTSNAVNERKNVSLLTFESLINNSCFFFRILFLINDAQCMTRCQYCS